jgi:hypothetical protein
MPPALSNDNHLNRVTWHGPGDKHGLTFVAGYRPSAVGHSLGGDPQALTDH